MPSTADAQSDFRGGIGKETAAMRLAKETRKQYDRKIKKLSQWYALFNIYYTYNIIYNIIII